MTQPRPPRPAGSLSCPRAGPRLEAPISLRRLVFQLAAAAVALLCLVAIGGSLLSRQIAGSQAVHEVAQTTDLLAESVFSPP